MKSKTQKQLWNDIAPEWHEFKKEPSLITKKFLQKQKGKILDLGSGSGRNLLPLKNAKMYLVDFSEKMIELARERAGILSEKKEISLLTNRRATCRERSRDSNWEGGRKEISKSKHKGIPKSNSPEFSVAPMTKLPFKKNFFDSAICISSLHCIETKKQREKTIRELHRILKLRAQVLVAVWNKNSKRFARYKTKEKLIGWRDKGKRYYYLYDEKEIHNLFEKNKFKIIKSQNSPLMIRFVAEKH